MSLVLEDDQNCFVCGLKNKEGLQIIWKVEGKATTAEYSIPKKYQGWKGIAHGGIVATLLDEAMMRLCWIVCRGALTAEMTVRFVAPVPLEEKLFIRGEIVKESRRIVEMKATISNASQKVLAHATGKSIRSVV